MSEETRKKMSESAKRRAERIGKAVVSNEFTTGSRHTADAIRKIKESSTGRKHKYKKRPHKAGENSPFWKGGISGERELFCASQEYKNWRRTVFARDGYTCVLCGTQNVPIEADHIKPYADYPHLRLDVDNGRTLCKPCHRQTDTWGSRTLWKKYKESKDSNNVRDAVRS